MFRTMAGPALSVRFMEERPIQRPAVMTQPSTQPPKVDWENPAWTADTEALATCLWRLIQIYRTGQAPAVRPPASGVHPRPSEVVAPEAARE